jgi:hypothetical protein
MIDDTVRSIEIPATFSVTGPESYSLAFAWDWSLLTNSVLYGDKLLTTPNADADEDTGLFASIGHRHVHNAINEQEGA